MQMDLDIERRAPELFSILLSTLWSCGQEFGYPTAGILGKDQFPCNTWSRHDQCLQFGQEIADKDAEPSSWNTRQAANILAGKEFWFAIAKLHLTTTNLPQGTCARLIAEAASGELDVPEATAELREERELPVPTAFWSSTARQPEEEN